MTGPPWRRCWPRHSHDDRRRVVSAGTLRGRDDVIADVSALADIGAQNSRQKSLRPVASTSSQSCPILGQRPAAGSLPRRCLRPRRDHADDQIGAHITFDLDDIDAAFEELDGRYLAGEAAAHAHTWSVVAGAIAAFNRHELPDSTPDFVLVDHRQFAIIEADALNGYTRVAWDQTPDLTIRIESVYLLNGVGSVFAIVAHGTSQDGFDAEWRMIELLTIEGDLVNRIELRDEADVDAALARFDELSRRHRDYTTRQAKLTSASGRPSRHATGTQCRHNWLTTCPSTIAVGSWALGSTWSRCRNGGYTSGCRRRGHERQLTVIATRGARLVLKRVRMMGRRPAPRCIPHRVASHRRDRRSTNGSRP